MVAFFPIVNGNRGRVKIGISRLLNELEIKFQWLPPIFEIYLQLFVKWVDVNGSGKSKMAAFKL